MLVLVLSAFQCLSESVAKQYQCYLPSNAKVKVLQSSVSISVISLPVPKVVQSSVSIGVISLQVPQWKCCKACSVGVVSLPVPQCKSCKALNIGAVSLRRSGREEEEDHHISTK